MILICAWPGARCTSRPAMENARYRQGNGRRGCGASGLQDFQRGAVAVAADRLVDGADRLRLAYGFRGRRVRCRRLHARRTALAGAQPVHAGLRPLDAELAVLVGLDLDLAELVAVAHAARDYRHFD